MGLATRRELVQAISARYTTSTQLDRVKILDEFVAATGYHRKHAIRVLAGKVTTQAVREPRLRLYDAAVREALIVLWEASARVCGKRLKPLIPILLDAMARHGHLHPRGRSSRAAARGQRRDDRSTARADSVRGSRPHSPRGHAVGAPRSAGADLQRLEGSAAGIHRGRPRRALRRELVWEFVHTLTVTDIASGWTECGALAVREGSLVVAGVTRLRGMLPFQMLGLDTDNGSEFLNETMLAYCREQSIEFTRSRPYRKNDQAWVEQKNGAVVRRLVGYDRLEGLRAAEALTQLYASSRLFVNFFQPCFKLASKTRVGARVEKRYHPPATPCARLLALDGVPEAIKDQLRATAATLDPVRLLDEIRAAQQHLARLSAGEDSHVAPTSAVALDGFLAGLATAWRDGEVRPIHRPKPMSKPRWHWRTRTDPFVDVWPRVCDWLDAEPYRTGEEILRRLQGERPGRFLDGQLRTLQRRVKEWRRAAVRDLVFAEPEIKPRCEKALPTPKAPLTSK
jgi:hypothetical protein